MTVTGPMVKDFTREGSQLPVSVVSGEVYEVLLTLFALGSHADGSLSSFSAGEHWFDEIRTRMSPRLQGLVDRFTGASEVWLELIGVALDLDEPSVAGLVHRIGESDPAVLRRRLISLGCPHCHSVDDRALVDLAATGDAGAIEALASEEGCCMSDGIRSILGMDQREMAQMLSNTITLFEQEAFATDVVAVLRRDAEDKISMARRLDPKQLVEQATNGITFEMQPDVEGIVLIPSVAIRPWVTITGHDHRRVFCYPVAEEHLDADADTPPSRLVTVYKALGDEKRLRLLRILAEDPASLAEITERVDLAKSTVHHHLSLLRQAGLVRITIGVDKEYSLRADAIPEAAELLSGFLDPNKT